VRLGPLGQDESPGSAASSGMISAPGVRAIACSPRLPLGNLYVIEHQGDRVRQLDASSGRISTAVGPPTGVAPPPPGDASKVEFRGTTALAIDAQPKPVHRRGPGRPPRHPGSFDGHPALVLGRGSNALVTRVN